MLLLSLAMKFSGIYCTTYSHITKRKKVIVIIYYVKTAKDKDAENT